MVSVDVRNEDSIDRCSTSLAAGHQKVVAIDAFDVWDEAHLNKATRLFVDLGFRYSSKNITRVEKPLPKSIRI